MRYLCYFFSLYVFLLSTIPCCPEKDCCQDEAGTCDSRQGEKKDCNTACSPFYSCSSCSGSIISNKTFCLFSLFTTIEKKRVVLDTGYTDFFIPSFWQPPKIS